MTTPNWQLLEPVDAIVFDCDGTLSSIEGVDELAKLNGVGESVQAMTADAMSRTGLTIEIYEQRLGLVRPTLQQVTELGHRYAEHQAPDAMDLIGILQRLDKSVYIVSAGLNPAVRLFGVSMGVSQERIVAVDVMFDGEGGYLDFDRSSPLTDRLGKREVVKQLLARHSRIVFVGDGLNDLAVVGDVVRFVGFGGSYFRQNIADVCDFYVCCTSMACLLPLCLARGEYERLLPAEKLFYGRGLELINDEQVLMRV